RVVVTGQGAQPPSQRQGSNYRLLAADQRRQLGGVVPRLRGQGGRQGGGQSGRQAGAGAADLAGGIEPAGEVQVAQRQVGRMYLGAAGGEPAGGLAEGEAG